MELYRVSRSVWEELAILSLLTREQSLSPFGSPGFTTIPWLSALNPAHVLSDLYRSISFILCNPATVLFGIYLKDLKMVSIFKVNDAL